MIKVLFICHGSIFRKFWNLDNGIFEIRWNNITRVMYFVYYEWKIILTNDFVKKTKKTPKKEIELAKERRRKINNISFKGTMILYK